MEDPHDHPDLVGPSPPQDNDDDILPILPIHTQMATDTLPLCDYPNDHQDLMDLTPIHTSSITSEQVSIPMPMEQCDPNHSWGTTFINQPPNDTITIMYQNIRRYPEDPYVSLTMIQRDYQPDVLCLCELSINLTKRTMDQMHKDFRSHWDHASISAAHTKDNFLNHKSKPGGVAVIALGKTTSKVTDKGRDNLGRWSWISITCGRFTIITIVTFYRPCQTSITMAGSTTYYMQLYRQHILQGAAPTINPRQQSIYDFADFLSKFTDHELIVTMDANEGPMNRDSTSIFDSLEELGLVSAYTLVTTELSTLPPTYNRGSQCIDHIYITRPLFQSIKSITIHPFGCGFNSDHRPITIQLTTGNLFHDLTRFPHRTIQTKYIKKAEAFREYHCSRMRHHKVDERIDEVASMMENEATLDLISIN